MKNLTRAIRKRMKGHERRKNNSVSSPSDISSLTTTNSPTPLGAGNHATVSRRVTESTLYPQPRETTPVAIAIVPSLHEAWGSMKSVQSSTPVPKISSNGLADEMARMEVIGITRDVQKFLATISELRQAMDELDNECKVVSILNLNDEEKPQENIGKFEDNKEEEEEVEMEGEGDEEEDKVVEKLKKLIYVVEQCLQSNQGMQSTELTRTSTELLETYDNCTHDGEKVSECSTCNKAIEQLCDAFTQSVSDYMMGDTQPTESNLPSHGGTPSHHTSKRLQNNRSLGVSKSYETLPRFGSVIDLTQPTAIEPIIDRIDQTLMSVENNVEVTAAYIKCRQKYHREILSCLLKRAQLEQRYYQQLNKLVKNTQASLAELRQQQECLPLMGVFVDSLEQDSRYAMNCNTTYNLQVGHKIIEVLTRKISEGDKLRKDLMHNWQRERRKVVEARNALKAAKTKYFFLGQELARLKNLLATDPYGKQAEKRKREATDMETRWQESEVAYKNAVAHCNDCQYQVHATAQKSILCAYRRMVIDFDASLKTGLETFYQLQFNFFKSLPEPLQNSMEDVQQYEVGSEFLNFIQKQPTAAVELEDYHFEEMDPEELFEEGTIGGEEGLESLSGSQPNVKSIFEKPNSPVHKPTDDSGLQAASTRVNTQNDLAPHRGEKRRPVSVVIMGIPSSPSPKPEPYLQRAGSEKPSSNVQAPKPTNSVDDASYSKMARTHNFKRLRTPARCRGCDTYVYFHGFECETCGLACHRKCLSTIAIRCGNKKLPRKMNTFGVDFHNHLKATKRHVPIIVTKCINEMDERGLSTQGLYRISSAKSKMERLCQLFEAGSERVDLSELPPHLISSCLKLYFRQLPEPLLTFDLYDDFLSFTREASFVLPCNFSKATPEREQQARALLSKLSDLILKLSEQTQLTLARLMYHLNRVSSSEHVKFNCMPASNLGIVFGPNLLRQREFVSSLAILANMSYQAKAVEIMVAHAHDIFHVPEMQIKELEVDADDIEITNERLVDDRSPEQGTTSSVELSPEHSNSPLRTLDVEDIRSTFSEPRTPYSTPPEKRKHNVEELHKALETFGNLKTNTSTKSNGIPPIQASPLLKDTRHMNDDHNERNLPGSIDEDSSLSETIMRTLDQRLSFKEILTPVIENSHGEDTSDDEEEASIINTSTRQNLDISNHRRRVHSLSKSSDIAADSISEVSQEIEVFRSRTPSNTSSTTHQKLFSSRSEDNLLQCNNFSPDGEEDEDEEGSRTANFEAEIKKILVESAGMKSSGSSNSDILDGVVASYKSHPPQAPDIKAILSMESSSAPTSPRSSIFSSSPTSAGGTPAFSLPRNFKHPPFKQHIPPVRKFSEGQLSLDRNRTYHVTSPPLTSPISLKSFSKASSQGSFSEGFSEELQEVSNLREKRDNAETDQDQDEKHTRGDAMEGFSNVDVPKVTYEENKERDGEEHRQELLEHARDSGIEHRSSVISNDDDAHFHDDIPLPDNSPITQTLHVCHINSDSRDSGLSDSPDPLIDFSREKASKLSPLRSSLKHNTQKLPQALPTSAAHSNVSVSTTVKDVCTDTQSDHVCQSNYAPHSTDPSTVQTSDLLHHDKQDAKPVSQRLRAASPEELISPARRVTVEGNMKRSKSHGESLSQKDTFKEESLSHNTRHGRLIIVSGTTSKEDSESTAAVEVRESPNVESVYSEEAMKVKSKKRRKYKSSECLSDSGTISSSSSHRRTPFFV